MRRRLAAWNGYGLTGLSAALVILAYWMLPLAIDRAVVLPQVDSLKVASLFAGGFMLRHSFERAPAVLQLFFVGYTASMMAWLGVYFATTDSRLCSVYSLQSQADAGRGLVALALACGIAWAITGLRRIGHVV